MDSSVVAIVVSALALILAGYVVLQQQKAGKPITAEFLTSTLEESTVMATELTEVALTAAQASEQLYRTGKLEKTQRLDHAFAYVKTWFPELDQARIMTAIEAGVFVVNSVMDGLPALKKAEGSD